MLLLSYLVLLINVLIFFPTNDINTILLYIDILLLENIKRNEQKLFF